MNKNELIMIKIMNELVHIYLNHGCNNVNINLVFDENKGMVELQGAVKNIDESVLNKLKMSLNTPRRDDTEEYYWGLLGSDYSSQLNLLDAMVDEGQLNYDNGILTLKVIRRF
ncbi:MAG: hypothetical protein H5T96_06405 [Tissierellales bacterium]|nr:hypothetical protein [Tissierellales bacterium]